MKNQTKIYNPNELYVAKLSDLIVFKIYDYKITIDEENPQLMEIRLYIHLISNIKRSSLPIILYWNEKNGEKYLEESLTGTKINVITLKNDARLTFSQELSQCVSENISHIETLFELGTNRVYFSETPNSLELPKIYNNGQLSLAIHLEDVKPISSAAKEEQISLLEYRNENTPSLNERKMLIESLKETQAAEIKPFVLSEKVDEPKEIQNDTLQHQFDSFVDEYKAKQKTLKKNK